MALSRSRALAEMSQKAGHRFGLQTLYDPPNGTVAAEIVFIHGLGGDSIKTWSDSSGKTPVCWPRDFLPDDPEFQRSRIHTFGYDANWKERTPSILSVRDFANALLGEIKNDPKIRNSNAGIIFVCHSMGGCVAKQAYVLAREDEHGQQFAARIRSMLFLATPHRGSKLGRCLQNVLLMIGVDKPFAKDLTANSSPVLQVNEAFVKVASGLRLWSFYETMPVLEYANILIVDQDSAHLNLPNEEVFELKSNHRRICKFSSKSDGNYLLVRNALVTAVNQG